MKNTLITILETPDLHDHSDMLCSVVMQNIEKNEIRALHVKTTVFGVLAVSAGVALFPAISNLSSAWTKSGFSDYFSLITSDTSYISAHWQSALTLFSEALPVTSVIVTITLALILVSSLRKIFGERSYLRDLRQDLSTRTA